MSTIARTITYDEFDKAFDSFAKRAFRFEALPFYDIEEEHEAFAAFKAGRPVELAAQKSWRTFLRECQRDAKTVERVRVITEPLTDYLRFEWRYGYVPSMRAGELIYAIAAKQFGDTLADIPDFWLFDDHQLIFLRYDEKGRFIEAAECTDADTLATYVELRDDLLRVAEFQQPPKRTVQKVGRSQIRVTAERLPDIDVQKLAAQLVNLELEQLNSSL